MRMLNAIRQWFKIEDSEITYITNAQLQIMKAELRRKV